jgi:P2 family phage contractile tail tube protein
MKTANPLPQLLIGFRAYKDDTDLIGVVDIELPEFKAISTEVAGAGVAGKVDAPVLGHFDPMSMTLNFRAWTKNVMELAKPKAHQMDLRGSIQVYDAGKGEYEPVAVQIVAKAMPSNTGPGKYTTGEAMETKVEMSIMYIKIRLNDEDHIEYDPFNYIFKVGDEDFLEKVKADLGL